MTTIEDLYRQAETVVEDILADGHRDPAGIVAVAVVDLVCAAQSGPTERPAPESDGGAA